MGNNVRWCSVFIASCLLLSHSVVTLKLFFNLSLLWLHTGPMHSHPTQYNVPHSRIFTATKQQQQSSTLSQCILHAPWEKIEKLVPLSPLFILTFSPFFWKKTPMGFEYWGRTFFESEKKNPFFEPELNSVNFFFLLFIYWVGSFFNILNVLIFYLIFYRKNRYI